MVHHPDIDKKLKNVVGWLYIFNTSVFILIGIVNLVLNIPRNIRHVIAKGQFRYNMTNISRNIEIFVML